MKFALIILLAGQEIAIPVPDLWACQQLAASVVTEAAVSFECRAIEGA